MRERWIKKWKAKKWSLVTLLARVHGIFLSVGKGLQLLDHAICTDRKGSECSETVRIYTV